METKLLGKDVIYWRLRTMTIDNFGCYGHLDLSFNKFQHHDFEIISGLNASGKSTIINAALWCMYNETPKYLRNEVIYNLDAIKKAEKCGFDNVKVSVKVEIEINDCLLYFERSVFFKSNDRIPADKFQYIAIANNVSEFFCYEVGQKAENILRACFPKKLKEIIFPSMKYEKFMRTCSNRKFVADIVSLICEHFGQDTHQDFLNTRELLQKKVLQNIQRVYSNRKFCDVKIYDDNSIFLLHQFDLYPDPSPGTSDKESLFWTIILAFHELIEYKGAIIIDELFPYGQSESCDILCDLFYESSEQYQIISTMNSHKISSCCNKLTQFQAYEISR